MSKVMVVDDNLHLRDVAGAILEDEGFVTVAAADGFEALKLIQEEDIAVAVVDFQMPGPDGLDVLRQMKARDPFIEVIMFTGYGTPELALATVSGGGFAYLQKPLDNFSRLSTTVREAWERRATILRNRELVKRLGRHIEGVEGVERAEGLSSGNRLLDMIRSLISNIEAGDPYARGHSEAVAWRALAIGREMHLPEDACMRLRLAGFLHDVGKVGVPSSILTKRGRPTPLEWEVLKRHAITGSDILRNIKAFEDIRPIVCHHHEQYDGRGYPLGLKGEEIPVGARVIAVSDAYDAIISDRSYRGGVSHAEALAILRQGSRSHWDSGVVSAFMQIAEKESPLGRVDGRSRYLQEA